jgi:formylglycine-generating enzyme required for sulfatase activity
VPSLRDWLTRKQKETKRGRAELLLADRAAVWNARPENRQLPSLLQWSQIRCLTQKKHWSPPQRQMMRRATRYHAVRGLVVGVVLALAGWGSYEAHGTLQAHALRDRLLDANTTDVPTIVADMAPYRRWLDPLLREAMQEAEAKQEPRKQLHTSLALVSVDPGQVNYLYERLLAAEPHEVLVIRQALVQQADELVDRLWQALERPTRGKESQRLRAASALALYAPESPRWAKAKDAIASDFVGVPAVYLATWLESLRPVRDQLVTPLVAIFRDGKRRDVERSLATGILAEYTADQLQKLADLLLDADEKQFAVLYPKFQAHGQGGLSVLQEAVDRHLPPDAKNPDREQLAMRQANAAVVRLRMNQPAQVWPLLKHSPDPRVRSYLIHRLAPLGADPDALVRRLDEEPDVTIRRALLLSLGTYPRETWPARERDLLAQKVQGLYRTADDPGLHGAAEWFLRQWQQEAWLRQTNDAWAKDKEQKERRLAAILQRLARANGQAQPQWYVNGQGQTMVVIGGPVEFVIGSPATEEGRSPVESQHRKRIRRSFALAATPVTKEQFLRFQPQFGHGEMNRYPDPTCPIGGVTWYLAAAYCNWLSMGEGLAEDQWCYETNAKGQVVKLKGNYLHLRGYRLPTEAEWEYVCRAGALTSRYYGESETLLNQYGWYSQNAADRTWPVGRKAPNDWGVFDMHGNIANWCQERAKAYPQAAADKLYDDIEDVLNINTQDFRALRGGSFFTHGSYVRSALRFRLGPLSSLNDIGLRPARTLIAE